MIKKLVLVNLLLLAIATWLVYRLDLDLKREAGRRDVSKIKPQPSRKAKPAPAVSDDKEKASNHRPPPLSWEAEYRIVADKNLFSEDRSLNKPAPVVVTIPELNPKPILNGIVKIDNKPMAFIAEGGATTPTPPTPGTHYPRPNTPGANIPVVTLPPRHEGVKRVEVGSEYKGYKVTEIAETSVTFTYGENKRSETIRLYEHKRPGLPAAPNYNRPVPPNPAVPPAALSGTPTPQVVTIGPTAPGNKGTPPPPPTRNVQTPNRPGTPGTSPAPASNTTIPSVGVPSTTSPTPSGTPGVNSSGTSNNPANRRPPTRKITTPFGTKEIQE